MKLFAEMCCYESTEQSVYSFEPYVVEGYAILFIVLLV
jgi:hypothetical protein